MTDIELAALESLIERVFERVVDGRLTQIESRLVGLTDAVVSLGGKVTALEIETHDLAARFARLRESIMTGRTKDTARIGAIEGVLATRMHELEMRVHAMDGKGKIE